MRNALSVTNVIQISICNTSILFRFPTFPYFCMCDIPLRDVDTTYDKITGLSKGCGKSGLCHFQSTSVGCDVRERLKLVCNNLTSFVREMCTFCFFFCVIILLLEYLKNKYGSINKPMIKVESYRKLKTSMLEEGFFFRFVHNPY